MFGCKACSGSDPAQDTVKFDAAAMVQKQQEAERAAAEAREAERRLQAEQEQRRALEAEARRRAEEEEAQRRRVEEARLQRQREEQERRRAEEQARRELEEKARQEEQERQARERAEAARRAEQERLEREAAETRARKATVATYLKEHGFKGGASDAKKGMISTTYPLHTAAKEGNARVVEMLLREGASTAQKNSSGKTAAQVAEKYNKSGSHAAVLRVLASGPRTSARAGGC